MFRKLALITLPLLLLTTASCVYHFPFKKEVRDSKNISSFALDGDYLYFGAGYHLYRVNLSSRSIETVFTTDRILVEQPVIANDVAYFGGLSYVDQKMARGETQGLFALELASRKVIWKFPLGVDGYGTFGTFPVVTDKCVIVCARQHLHCVDRTSGKEIWKLDNWMGKDSDGVTIPYVYKNHVYFKIGEEYFTKNRELDGHWAQVALDSGKRVAVLPIAENPGKYEDADGQGIGRLVDGVVYGALRYEAYPLSRFGALDLQSQKRLWEIPASSLRTMPAVNDKLVFTVLNNAVSALERTTGRVVWSEPLGPIAETNIDRSKDRLRYDYENYWSRRFAATNEVMVVQGSHGIVARSAADGKLLWTLTGAADSGTTDPLILDRMVVVASLGDCSIFALDLTSGRELWRVKIPDCAYYYILDD
jgi:outer membrane protein assembly factor BamB